MRNEIKEIFTVREQKRKYLDDSDTPNIGSLKRG